jgi:phosphoglycolate phosphatase
MPDGVLVFDVDGTLVDSAPDILAAVRYSFSAIGLPDPDPVAVRAAIGLPLAGLLSVLAPADRAEELSEHYRAYYAEHLLDRSQLYPGVAEALAGLSRHYRLAVATNKRASNAYRLLSGLGVLPHFCALVGADQLPPKPAPHTVRRAVAASRGRGLWMVGDSPQDILAGRAAGLRTYGVVWDHPVERLLSVRPDILGRDLHHLVELLLE